MTSLGHNELSHVGQPTIHRLANKGCEYDYSKGTGWIVLKFDTHIGGDSILIWWGKGHGSNAKVTASEKVLIWSNLKILNPDHIF